MNRGCLIAAAVAVTVISFHKANETYARGPTKGSTHANRSRAAVAATHAAVPANGAGEVTARMAAREEQFVSQMPLPLANLANSALATRLATANTTLLSARTAQILQQNPRLSPQQALLVAERESSGIATQIAASTERRIPRWPRKSSRRLAFSVRQRRRRKSPSRIRRLPCRRRAPTRQGPCNNNQSTKPRRCKTRRPARQRSHKADPIR